MTVGGRASILRLFVSTTLALRRAFRKRQPPVNLPGRVHIAFAVFVNLGKLAGAVVGMFGEKETTF